MFWTILQSYQTFGYIWDDALLVKKKKEKNVSFVKQDKFEQVR